MVIVLLSRFTAYLGKNVLICGLIYTFSPFVQAELSLQQAQQLAIHNDPWLKGNKFKEQSLIASSIAAASLPDPVLSFGLANLPTDGFSLNQEPMTQVKVGISQQFARGDSLSLKQQQIVALAQQNPLLRLDRQGKIKVMMATLWLNAFAAQQRVSLIKQNRALFSQLVDIVEASYSSAQGFTRQQDVIRAQVELSRLDDRLITFQSDYDTNIASMIQWLYEENALSQPFTLTDEWPVIVHLDDKQKALMQAYNQRALMQQLAQHPAILAIEQQIKSQTNAVLLAEQKYQPQWGVNASYAYRDEDTNGASRADFISVGLTVDLPFFTEKRQDKEIESAKLQAESIKTEKQLQLRIMLGQLIKYWQELQRNAERITTFQSHILPQMSEQAESALSAYTTDDGDFAEVMRARIAQLNTALDFINLRQQQALLNAQLDYFLSPITATNNAAARQGEFQ